MIIVTAAEMMEINELALLCETAPDVFNEERWEKGLRLILGSTVVDEMKRVKEDRPETTFPLCVGELLTRR